MAVALCGVRASDAEPRMVANGEGDRFLSPKLVSATVVPLPHHLF